MISRRAGRAGRLKFGLRTLLSKQSAKSYSTKDQSLASDQIDEGFSLRLPKD